MNVTAVKIYVLCAAAKLRGGYGHQDLSARQRTTLGPFNDGFKRHVFVTTIRLPNISGRRMTP